ncbi:MAG: sugar porter family MFS transporter [Pseudomonadota bacterium]|jgi:SP family sugar:H+ symporter-like MFS transporter
MSTNNVHAANTGVIAAFVAVATIGGFMFGYDSGVVNGTQAGLESAFDLKELGTGLTVGAILVGCAMGAFAAGRLADVLGRRRVMMISAVLFLASAVAAAFADSAVTFILARIVGGFGVGAASVLSPAYISEVTPAGVRGRLATVQQIMIITGLTSAFVMNFVLAKVAGSSTAPFWYGFPAWRWMFLMQVVPAAVYFVALLGIPESPRFLVLRGRLKEAEAVLSRLFGADEAVRKVAEIRASLAEDHRPRLADLIDPATGKVRKIVWAGIGLAVFQQLVGINIIFYYGAVLWQSVGFTEADSLINNILSGGLSIGACFLTTLLIDRIGRRPLLLIGSLGMAVTLAIVAWCFSTATVGADGAVQLAPNLGQIALISALAYVAFFNLSWGPVMWVMLGEMFPTQLRGSGLAVSGFAQWIANFAISVSFLWLAKYVGLAATYGFYAASALISFFFVSALVRETAGVELEAMEG